MAQMPDLSQMLANVSAFAPAVAVLIQAVATVGGFIFVAQGLNRFRKATERGEATVAQGFMYAVSGVALINLAFSVDVAFDLLYGGSGASVNNLMAYQSSGALPEEGVKLLKIIILLMQTFGLFFVVSGFMQMRKLQDNRQGSDVTVKGTLFRIFAGSALLNLVLTVNTVSGWLGFGSVM